MSDALRLREVRDEDLPVLYEHQRDPEAARMADFPSRDHDAFMAHWARIRAEPVNLLRVIEYKGQVAGTVLSFPRDGVREVGYWIDRSLWGRGIATRALTAFLELDPERPLFAGVAKHNAGSLRVLEKCGFRPHHETEGGFILVLDPAILVRP